jgi:hypothetical protein
MMALGLYVFVAVAWFIAGVGVGVRRERRRMDAAVRQLVNQYPPNAAGDGDE